MFGVNVKKEVGDSKVSGLRNYILLKVDNNFIFIGQLNIQKTKIMAFGPITSWQIVGGKVETVTDCVFLDSKITVDGDCSYEIKTLAPWKESYEKP